VVNYAYALLIAIFSLPVMAVQLSNQVGNESTSHQARIQILQKADVCIKNAKTKADYDACEGSEKNAREQFQQQSFAQKKQEIIARLSSRLTCVQKAQQPSDMKACQQNQ
jgi:hypothetical protein